MDKPSISSEKVKKSGKKRIVRFVSLGVIVAAIFFAFFIPSLMSDGTERLSGDQKKIAGLQLEEAPRLLDATDRFAKMILKYRVESTYETPKDQLTFWCGSTIDKKSILFCSNR